MGTDQDDSGPRRQFNAAVSVIQSLPKNGSYSPSYEEMLRFYSYYKQATVGPCAISRPGFWDPIGRYKWDAWNKLGAMSQEDAMCAYIKEMKLVAQKIINTVPLDDTSPEMFEPFRPLYEVIPDMPRPPDSFFKKSPEQDNSGDEDAVPSQEEAVYSPSETSPRADPQYDQTQLFSQAVHAGEERSDPVGEATSVNKVRSWAIDDDDFCDSVEDVELEKDWEGTESGIQPQLFQAASDIPVSRHQGGQQKEGSLTNSASDIEIGHNSHGEQWLENSSGTSNGPLVTKGRPPYQLNPQITATVEALQTSMQGVCLRLEVLEKLLQDQQAKMSPVRPKKATAPWSSLLSRSRTLFLIFIWPFIVHWLLHRLYRRKR
ncbi:acyl-CoA-binding domain-containing protein 4 [Spea bombifrons]|uniref:acyl-CoA-binding domain-containing protein 4 n=1 Tax=Spea bombifrons TaxID=233779 RepID=UPI00234B2EC7|nr:acyl-CoA-binding domain-containing protein 4 [Spea bombifrons]